MPETSNRMYYPAAGSSPAIQEDDVIDFSYMDFDGSTPTNPTFELPVDGEPENLIETSHLDTAIPREHSESVPENFSDV